MFDEQPLFLSSFFLSFKYDINHERSDLPKPDIYDPIEGFKVIGIDGVNFEMLTERIENVRSKY